MSDQHIGVRRRPARIRLGRVLPIVAGLAVVAWALTLGEPPRAPLAASSPISVVPTWTAPTVDIPGVLADGATYAPRLYLTPDTSVGVATGADGTVRVILARASGSFTELRRLPAGENPQVNGFAVDGDTLVWMESTTRNGAPATTLWRTTWSVDTPPVRVTTDTGEPTFIGFATDVVIHNGTVTWISLDPQGSGGMQVRSVPVGGGPVTVRPLDGEYRLSAPPWVVTATAGPGQPITLLNLDTNQRIDVSVEPTDVAVCDPVWCRLTVINDQGLVAIDVMQPDGTGRRRIAGPEATPTIGDVALLDRYVPLSVDRSAGVGLSIVDLTTGKTQLVAARATNVAGRGGIVWWSTGAGPELIWHSLDLARLP
ncbi:MAG: hypothetical protein IRY85_02070 [Micromonosporaceae bacterium]|nr:hypothetical protein [Micromonosporaceae bacterium]